MEKMNDLRDLLHHEVLDLTSAEDQILMALPKMIEKATNSGLKKALQEHLRVTERQRKRLEKVHQLLHNGRPPKNEESGLFGKLFGGDSHKCKGTEGLIEEGEKIMKEEMNPEVMDAAIIASAQKIEHYEICAYGTARAFAEELGMTEVAELLYETLNEEYEADDILTEMAVNRLNKEAESAGRRRSKGSTGRGNGNGNMNRSAASKQVGRGGSAKTSNPNTADSKKTGAKTAAAKKPAAKAPAKKTADKSGKQGSATRASTGRGR